MSGSLNRCEFIGNLGADPEVRSFSNGGRVCNLRLACTETWKKDGQKQERTEWVSVAIFTDGLVGVAERYLRKGSKIYVAGKWSTRKWQTQAGEDRYSTECVLQGPDAKLIMLDGKGEGTGERKREYADSGDWGGGSDDDLDGDRIPF